MDIMTQRTKEAKQTVDARLYIDDLPVYWEERLWNTYEESFAYLDTYQEQKCYDRSTFVAALRDPDYLKFVISEGDYPIGLAMATNDMAKVKVAYINTEFLRKRYPEEIREGRFFYVTSIFIDPNGRGIGHVKSLLHAMLSYMKAGRRVAGFDFCESKEFLAKLIEDLSRDYAVNIPVNSIRMDAQAYYVLELDSVNELPEP